MKAFRGSIWSQTAYIKNMHMNNDPRCKSCGNTHTNNLEFDLDHCGMDFVDIANIFMEIHGEPNPDDIHQQNASYTFADQTYCRKWKRFHDDTAKYQLLCVPCHNTKSNKKRSI
jgi:hypothetical protein